MTRKDHVNASTASQLQNNIMHANHIINIIFDAMSASALSTIGVIRRGTAVGEIPGLVQLLPVCIIGIILSGALSYLFEEPTLPSTINDWMYVFGHMISSLIVACGMAYCYKFISPTVVSLLYNLNLVWFVMFQYTVLADINPGHRNLLEYIGLGLVLVASSSSPFIMYFKGIVKNTDKIVGYSQIENRSEYEEKVYQINQQSSSITPSQIND